MVDRFLHLLLRLIDYHDHEFLAQYVCGKFGSINDKIQCHTVNHFADRKPGVFAVL